MNSADRYRIAAVIVWNNDEDRRYDLGTPPRTTPRSSCASPMSSAGSLSFPASTTAGGSRTPGCTSTAPGPTRSASTTCSAARPTSSPPRSLKRLGSTGAEHQRLADAVCDLLDAIDDERPVGDLPTQVRKLASAWRSCDMFENPRVALLEALQGGGG